MTESRALALPEDIGAPALPSQVSAIIPRTPDEVGRYVDALIKYDVVPASYATMPGPKKFGSMVIAVMKGMELGMTPLLALQSIYVVNGMPTLYGDAVPRFLLASGLLEDCQESYEGDGDARIAVCKMKRRGVATPMERRFSVANAAAMKLLGKPGPWQHSRDRMLMIRARTYCARDLFADALGGLGVVEEQEDIRQSDGLPRAPLGPPTDIDPLADLVIDADPPEDVDQRPLDPEEPRALQTPPEGATDRRWKLHAKILRDQIEEAKEPETKHAWWNLNSEPIEAKSEKLAAWVKEMLPAEDGGEDDAADE